MPARRTRSPRQAAAASATAPVVPLPSAYEPLTRERIEELSDSFVLALKADRHAANTIKLYSDGVRAYLRWCEANDQPPDLSRHSAQLFIVSLLESGRSPSTALARQRGLCRFSRWAAEELEIAEDQLTGKLRYPRLDVKPPRALADDEVRALLATCEGSRQFADLRDHAILSTLADTGCRTGELLALTLEDLSLRDRRILIRHTKTGKGRITGFGPQTARSLDRYLRSRRRQRYAHLPNLWLSTRSPGV